MMNINAERSPMVSKMTLVLMLLATVGVLAVAYNTYTALEILADINEQLDSFVDLVLDTTLFYRPTAEEVAQWEQEDDWEYI